MSPLPKPAAFYGQIDLDGRYTSGDPLREAELVRTVVVNGAIYVGRPATLLQDRTFQSAGALAWSMPFERSWDIDTPADFAVCEALFPLRGNTAS